MSAFENLVVKGNLNKAEISLCMIVKNEEHNIGRCLSSVKDLVDEIIIVDTGSSDKTKEIALQYTDKVYDFEWIDDFGAARNFAFSKGTKEYLMWLDADDIIKDSNKGLFLETKKFLADHPECDWVTMIYQIAHDKQGNPLYSYKRERIIKKSLFRLEEGQVKWVGAVHECIAIQGAGSHSPAIITHTKNIAEHLTDRNLKILLNKVESGKPMDTREYFYLSNELFDHQRYQECLKYYDIFFSKDDVFVEDGIAACIKACQAGSMLGNKKIAKEYAMKSFIFAPPRAEACCLMGDFLFGENNFKDAIFWYDLATKLTKPADSMGGFIEDCWTWSPHVQLAACYDRFGAVDQAYLHNELALQHRPDHEGLLKNKEMLLQKKPELRNASITQSPVTQLQSSPSNTQILNRQARREQERQSKKLARK
jgi:glycosyltransferase involved in cell wall biosynthesis